MTIIPYSNNGLSSTLKRQYGRMENRKVDKIKQWILFSAWNPNPVNLNILKNNSIINVSFNIPRIKEIAKIIIAFVIVKYIPSKPYWSFSISSEV